MSETLGYFDPKTTSNTWGLRHITDETALKDFSAWVFLQDGKLYLDQNKQPDLKAFSLDYASGRSAQRLKEIKHSKLPIAKACGLKKGQRPDIIDATSGYAQDGLLLAAMGSKVTMIEQHPLIFAIVSDALNRAMNSEQAWLTKLLENIAHKHVNAEEYLAQHTADVIYLDPMYPERDKGTTAQVKKGMQILRSLPGCYSDTTELFEAALNAAKQRVVVKRPSWADNLGNRQPNTVVSMPNHNFDIYLTS